ncbi:hypothetical protein [Deinococcus sp. PESE-13]
MTQESSYSYLLAEFANVCTACVVSVATLEFRGLYASLEIENRIASLDRGEPPSENVEEALERMRHGISIGYLTGMHRSDINRAVFFTKRTMVARMADSFEWYLKRLLIYAVTQKPELMRSSRQAKDLEFNLPISFIVDSYNQEFSEFKSVVAQEFANSVMSGPAFKRAIEFFEKKINGKIKILSDDEQSFLISLFRVRNSIVHEGMATPQSDIEKIVRAKEGGEEDFSPGDQLHIAFQLCKIAVKIEDVVRRAANDPEVFFIKVEAIEQILNRSWDVSALLVNNHSSPQP